ncbi:MAG TPA: FHA domain-containing protein [Anaerolineales bacterium]
MIICLKCGHKNITGSVYCEECGSQLAQLEDLVTQRIEPEPGDLLPPRGAEREARRPAAKLDTWGTMHLLDTGQMLPLSERGEFTLGRVSEGQPIMPDIDLSPYHAYASGVSRLHAVIKRNGERITIMDLGSSNGTYVNGKRLTANSEQMLHHGDVITFGKLKIQILLRS